MKLSTLFAALLVAATLVSGSAMAATYTTTTGPNIYDVKGTLAANTEITFTYTSNGSSPGKYLLASADESVGANDASTTSLDPIDGSPATSTESALVKGVKGGILTVLTVAQMGGTSTITIENLTDKVASFEAYFAATKLLLAGTFSVSGPIATPLPAALVLFLTAIAGLFGFNAFRKARNEA